jgi:hypothetical protein
MEGVGPVARLEADTASTRRKASSSKRPSKFTPQAIEKIKECVKQGLGREDIALLLDVTVGSLQVTCSRLGISLRRPSQHDPSHDQLKTQLPPQSVEQGSPLTAKFALTIKRKDGEWALDVPLSEETIGELAIEAAFRGMGIGELIVHVLCEAAKKDMVGTILDGEERAARRR